MRARHSFNLIDFGSTISFLFLFVPSAYAVITTTGDVFPLIGPGDFNAPNTSLNIGSGNAPGTVEAVNANVTVNTVAIAFERNLGSLTLDNSNLTLTGDAAVGGIALDIGTHGHGTLRVLNGSSVDATFQGADCEALGCWTFLTNGAGSTGFLEVSGVGTTFDAVNFEAGHASVFTQENDGFDFGTPGASSSGFVLVSDNAAVTTQSAGIGAFAEVDPSGLGNERAFGNAHVTTGATWVSNTFFVGLGERTNGTVIVDEGASVEVDTTFTIGDGQVEILSGGQVAQNQMFVGGGEIDAIATVKVSGTGSALNGNGNDTFITAGPWASGNVEILDGASVSDLLVLDAGFFTEGRGTIRIDGENTTVALSGVCSDCASIFAPEGAGAGLFLGTGGNAAATISGGATVTIDGTGNTAGTGVYIGQVGFSAFGGAPDFGIGGLEIDGANTTVTVSGGNELLIIGNNGGIGGLVITRGAVLTLSNDAGNAQTLIGNGNSNANLGIDGLGSLLDSGAMFTAGNADGTAGSNVGIVLSNGGELRADDIFLNAGTVVTGDGGTLNGTVHNNATILPGNSPGTLNVIGDLNLLEEGTLVIEIGGTDPGVTYDVINVTGTVTLDGTLEIRLIDGFVPSDTDTFVFLDALAMEGGFTSVVLPVFGNQTLALDVSGALIVTAVPLPASAWLLVSAFGVLAARARGRAV